tara:strand:- start:544 stop:729 length:186 start_codon:yes stop_codon:yes gene_type:complete
MSDDEPVILRMRMLVVPVPGALRFVDGDGKLHEKPMTPGEFIHLAERCLRAARETGEGNDR